MKNLLFWKQMYKIILTEISLIAMLCTFFTLKDREN